METDHATATRDARDALKTVLRATFRSSNAADIAAIMAAIDALIVAEMAASRQSWRDELRGERAHEAAVSRAQQATAAYKRQARILRGEPDPDARRCTNPACTTPAGKAEFYADKKRVRPWCKNCERRAGADRRARLAAPASPGEPRPARHLTAVG